MSFSERFLQCSDSVARFLRQLNTCFRNRSAFEGPIADSNKGRLELVKLIEAIDERQPSDIFIIPDAPPLFKIEGRIVPSGLPKLGEQDIFSLIDEIDRDLRSNLESEKDYDFSSKTSSKKTQRLRASALLQQLGKPSLVLRTVSMKSPTLESLSMPPRVRRFLIRLLGRESGLILVAGGTGSGKSSLLSAMLSHLIENAAHPKHILIVEDPIERIREDFLDYKEGKVKAIVTHRQIGKDTKGYKEALRGALRQAPDVIIIGEIREKETMELTLQAAQTGHLVISTVHAIDSYQCINRVVNFFEDNQHESVRYQLAECLLGIISQRLLKRAYTVAERIALIEVMETTDKIRELIIKNCERKHVLAEITDNPATQSFDQHRDELKEYDFIDVG